MKKILVTGATGQLGREIALQLTDRVGAHRVAALVRDPAKAQDLAGRGIEVRQGDYLDPAALARAFAGVDKLMFVSTSMFSDVNTQHRNVVEAANTAGVRHVHYTAIQHPERSAFAISQVSEMDRLTESALAESGMDVTVMRNTLYMDALPFLLGADTLSRGVYAPAGHARAALAARADLAEAAAIILSGSGHEGRSYTLGGSTAVSMADVAAILSGVAGKPLPYVDQARADYIAGHVRTGLPDFVAAFMSEWFEALRAGEFAGITGDLERILGRQPLTPAQFLPTLFTVQR
jgi:NAD(P)H dehydrogenase (quinone)